MATTIYTTPEGSIYTLFETALAAPHLLIAGASGSGKSVLENGLIATLLYRAPGVQRDGVGLILLDPKRVELARYKDLPHTLVYASEPREMVEALHIAVALVERRYKDMAARGLLQFDGGDVYVIIDEFADLMTTQKREVMPLVQRLAQIGRAAAARMHIILCTQCPLATVIPTEIKVNFDVRFCLRTATKAQSRYIMDASGCELLPNPRTEGKAHGYYVDGAFRKLYELPYIQQDEIQRLISHWTAQAPTPTPFSRSADTLPAQKRPRHNWTMPTWTRKRPSSRSAPSSGFFVGLFKLVIGVLVFLYALIYCAEHFK